MITFKYLELRNFMSVGNAWLHFDYRTGLTYVYGENHDVAESNDMTLISNGSGKTVVLVDAPLFALYGRTQRRIKRAEIINIQNGCDCEVKLCFEKDGSEYVIERGLKPDKIIIIKDGVPESEEAKKRQANKVIEEEILDGISYEVFKNLIVLNGTSSKHFFEYGKNEKRAFINEVFRLGFLDYLQSQLTEDVKAKRTEVEKTDIQKEAKEKEIERLRNLAEAQENGEVYDNTTELQNKILEESQKIATAQATLTEIATVHFDGDVQNYQQKCDYATQKITETNNEIVRMDSSITNLRNQYQKLKNDYENIANESFCSHCTQSIPDSLKQTLFSKLKNEGAVIVQNAEQMKGEKEELDTRLEQMREWLKTAKTALETHQTTTQALATSTTLMQEYQNQLNASNDPVDSLEKINEEIKTAEEELKEISTKLYKDREEYKVLKVSRDLVGGKNFYGYYIGVFRNYLNKAINEYLEKMVSPHRIRFNNSLEADVFDGDMGIHSYDNLSTGEKAKINIALLLSFFDVLHSFHRMETSLLVLDEVLDTGIDSVGIVMLHKILRKKIENNPHLGVYVVSHKNSENTFAEKEGIGKVVFERRMGFTTLQED
jgi:DNA repair exonuclease SbcCD ATPase subunit